MRLSLLTCTVRRSGSAAHKAGCGNRPSPRRRVHYVRCGHSLRQVFGLTGYLIAPASQSHIQTSAVSELSFLITAAGQFRTLTGFPSGLLLKATTGNSLSIDQIDIRDNVSNSRTAADVKACLVYLGCDGGPGRSPTCDLRVRSALLYATELPGHVWLVYREGCEGWR